MFSQAWVKNSVHMRLTTPPGQTPPWADTPLGRHPPRQTPPSVGHCNGRYASYWECILVFVKTRMHSSRMRTTRAMTSRISGGAYHAHPPFTTHTPFCHTCPPGATIHAPRATTHTPGATMHTPKATTHAPPKQPRTPPPGATTHPLVNRITDRCKNITFAN